MNPSTPVDPWRIISGNKKKVFVFAFQDARNLWPDIMAFGKDIQTSLQERVKDHHKKGELVERRSLLLSLCNLFLEVHLLGQIKFPRLFINLTLLQQIAEGEEFISDAISAHFKKCQWQMRPRNLTDNEEYYLITSHFLESELEAGTLEEGYHVQIFGQMMRELLERAKKSNSYHLRHFSFIASLAVAKDGSLFTDALEDMFESMSRTERKLFDEIRMLHVILDAYMTFFSMSCAAAQSEASKKP